jgi:hypothetical protein
MEQDHSLAESAPAQMGGEGVELCIGQIGKERCSAEQVDVGHGDFLTRQ